MGDIFRKGSMKEKKLLWVSFFYEFYVSNKKWEEN